MVPAESGSGVKHLYFVRHGLSEMNKAGRWAGRHTETPLASEGEEQARIAGEHAKRLRIDHIVSSPQIRAHDTARIIAEAINYPEHKIELNSLFVERGYGVLEGTPWAPDLNVDGFADVEALDAFHERIHLAYKFLLTLPDDTVLVVSHGAVGRALRHILYAIDPTNPFHATDKFDYGKIVRLL